MMQLREALSDIPHQQLHALAVSWNNGRNFRNRDNIEDMYAIFSGMIDFMIEKSANPQHSEAIC